MGLATEDELEEMAKAWEEWAVAEVSTDGQKRFICETLLILFCRTHASLACTVSVDGLMACPKGKDQKLLTMLLSARR